MALEIEGAESLARLSRSLKEIENRKEVTAWIRREFRKKVPPIRKLIKAQALRTLPRRGGLNRWVSSTRVTAKFKLSGREFLVALKGGRNSQGGRTDTRAIDRGRVRAPSWGHRTKGSWHTTTVEPGFFTKGAGEGEALNEWRQSIITAANEVSRRVDRG